MEHTCLLEATASCRLLRSAVKGILDQIQRWIKTSAPHFTSISPTFPEHCRSAAGVNNGCFFCATSHIPLWPDISLFFSPPSFSVIRFLSHCHPAVSSLPLPPVRSEISPLYTFSLQLCSAYFLPRFFSCQAVEFWRNQVFKYIVKRWGMIFLDLIRPKFSLSCSHELQQSLFF